jgi:Putative DNA-binding domain
MSRMAGQAASQAASQAALAAWIWRQSPEVPQGLRAVGAQPLDVCLSAYREHAKALCARALGTAYPMLQAWLGDPNFAGLAWAYARAHPPTQGDMNRWGLTLAQFLASQPNMDAQPVMLASLEAHLHALNGAPDTQPIAADFWTALQNADARCVRLECCPSLALFPWLPDLGEGSIQRPDAAETAVHALAWRQGWRPVWTSLGAPMARWIQACLEEASLAGAVEVTLAAHPGFDLGQALRLGYQLGWWQGVQSVD